MGGGLLSYRRVLGILFNRLGRDGYVFSFVTLHALGSALPRWPLIDRLMDGWIDFVYVCPL